MIVRIVCGGGNDPYDRDDYMETRLKLEYIILTINEIVHKMLYVSLKT